jgi:three-Cys-motif partner protein
MKVSEAEGDDGLPVRASGIWAKEKLYYLEHYLDIFSVGMHKKWHGKLYYIDLFAGPGRCLVRETKEEVDGSPLIALKFDFAKYFFVETDSANYTALSARVKTRSPQKDVVIIPGDCNEEIGKIKPAVGSLGLAFIDPTGISSIAFDTIRVLTQSRQMDLIINFPRRHGYSYESPSIYSKRTKRVENILGQRSNN